jgi:hypothetical protein
MCTVLYSDYKICHIVFMLMCVLIPHPSLHSIKYDRIIQELRIDLVQCGWRDEMQARAIEIVKQNSGGLSVLTMEELFMEIVKDGKTLVPDDVKALVIEKVKESIQSKNA